MQDSGEVANDTHGNSPLWTGDYRVNGRCAGAAGNQNAALRVSVKVEA